VSKYLILNATNALGTSANNVWGSALPTSSVFGVTSNIAYTANADIVCYCFAPVEGYSAFGSYVGNSSADGPFIYTGFRPRWIMLKSSSSGGTPGFDWIIYDSSRDGYNWSNPQLIANAAVPEDTDSGGSSFTGLEPDILSNGFKHRASSNGRNGSGITYIWAAFAESPFKYARAR
jgi:hypothetical protein